MGQLILEKCGILAVPQLVLSGLIVALLMGYLIALRRREIEPGQCPWDRTLEPLAGISTTLGLLGSVLGFIVAFSGFADGVDVPRLTSGLSTAYWTTGVGIVSALVAALGAYVLTVLNRPRIRK
ncbi:MAG: MotA/TolQ/ExbB proton channel family protein [Phycisphaerae bacterium]